MAKEQAESSDYAYDALGKLRDLEEKQNLTRDRVLLIGKNLIDSRENTKQEIGELKIELDSLKKEFTRLRDTVQNILEESVEFARKAELESVKKQLDLFSPLELASHSDVEKIIKKHKDKQSA
jgi:seryl-tRNA synthetase